MWRTTPLHRRELAGWLPEDAPPALPPNLASEEIQQPEDGVGPLVHRLYRTRIRGPQVSPEQLMETVAANLDCIAPTELASFQPVDGEGKLAIGDEYIVRIPGPWDGPVVVTDVTPTSFRLATLDGHLEAGQIEFRAFAGHRGLDFVIESWARSGDRLSDLMYTRLRMAKEVQLHMWTRVLERVVALTGGRMSGGIVITTRRVEPERSEDSADVVSRHGRARRRLAGLEDRPLNFDPDQKHVHTVEHGWHVDDMTEPLPHEPSGPPAEGGSWEVAGELMHAYQVADPAMVRATYRRDEALSGRNMLLAIRFHGLAFHVGVRVGEVYDEEREVGGRQARVFGWDYATLEGHFEQGQIHYEIWKWLDTGDVEFRLHAFSRVADSGPLVPRLGYRIVGRRQQMDFYRRACRRMRTLTEAELERRRSAAG